MFGKALRHCKDSKMAKTNRLIGRLMLPELGDGQDWVAEDVCWRGG